MNAVSLETILRPSGTGIMWVLTHGSPFPLRTLRVRVHPGLSSCVPLRELGLRAHVTFRVHLDNLQGRSIMKVDEALRKVVTYIVAGDAAEVSRMMGESPQLARASFQAGATRDAHENHFIDGIRRYIYRGDTGLHIAAAAYRPEIVRKLIETGA